MLVREIMTSPAYSVHREDDLDAALELMAGHRVTTLPVVDDQGNVVGVLSEVDVLRRAVEPDARAHLVPVHESEALPAAVGEIMTPSPKTATENTDVSDLTNLFLTTKFKSLPVVRGKKLVGVISRSDVIRALWRPDADILADLKEALLDLGRTDWHVSVNHGVAEVIGPQGTKQIGMADAIARSVLGVRRVHVVEN